MKKRKRAQRVWYPHEPGRFDKHAPYWRGERAETIVNARVRGYRTAGKKKVRLAFTGTQHGCTGAQRRRLKREVDKWLGLYGPEHIIFVHGGCTGGDYEFHMSAFKSGGRFFEIWPSDRLEKDRSKAIKQRMLLSKRDPAPAITMHRAKPPLERNADVIRGAVCLLACPRERREVTRSGTWSTVRLARKAHIRVKVLAP